MRILFLASTFHPKIGGAETYALNLCRGLTALGHGVEVVTDGVAGEPTASELTPGLSVKRLHAYRYRLDAADRIRLEEMAFGLLPEVAQLASAFRPDIVISNSLDMCITAKLVSLSCSVPWVATFHEQAPERDPLGEATLQLCYGLLEPDAVIAGSRFYQQRAETYGRKERCHLIYHGVDTHRFRDLGTASAVRAKFRIPSTAALLLSLGRFKARKGFLDLIHAFAEMIRSGRPANLIIAGSLNSASQAYLEEMHSLVVRLGLTGHVHIEDDLAHDDVPWLLSGSDVVIQASLEEGLGLAVIEAMACARPAVVTRIAGHTEVVSEDRCALLVEPGAPQEIARAIVSLLHNADLRKTLAENGRAHVVRNFSLEAMAAATAELLQASIADRTPA